MEDWPKQKHLIYDLKGNFIISNKKAEGDRGTYSRLHNNHFFVTATNYT